MFDQMCWQLYQVSFTFKWNPLALSSVQLYSYQPHSSCCWKTHTACLPSIDYWTGVNTVLDYGE